MCMALRVRRHDRAILGTILRVMLAPWLGILLGIFLTIGSRGIGPDVVEVLVFLWLVGSLGLSTVIAVRAGVALEDRLRALCGSVGSEHLRASFVDNTNNRSGRHEEASFSSRITHHASR